MRTVTATELLTKIRLYADVVNDNHISTAELYTYVSAALGELWDRFVQAHPDAYTKSTTWTGDGTTTDFSVASDFLGHVAVDRQLATGTYAPLTRIGQRERNVAPQTAGTAEYWMPIYNSEAQDKVRLLPTPATGQTYRHVYVRCAPVITTGADVINGHDGWDEGIAILAAISVAIRQGRRDLESSLQARLARFDERLNTALLNRMPPGRVVDVYESDFAPSLSDRRFYPYT
jgi:hypothetical protein